MKPKACSFCNTLSLKIIESLVYENDQVLVILDEDWVVLGHALVIFKRHLENISHLTLKEYQTFSQAVWKTEQALNKILGDKRCDLEIGWTSVTFSFSYISNGNRFDLG